MPDGDQFRNPDLVLGQDRLQRVVPALLFCPVPERAPPGPFPGSLPRCPPLAARCRQIMQRSRRRRWSRRTGLRHEAFLRCGRHGYRRISYRRRPAVHMLPGSHPGHTTAGDSSPSPDPDDQCARTRTCGWSTCRTDSADLFDLVECAACGSSRCVRDGVPASAGRRQVWPPHACCPAPLRRRPHVVAACCPALPVFMADDDVMGYFCLAGRRMDNGRSV